MAIAHMIPVNVTVIPVSQDLIVTGLARKVVGVVDACPSASVAAVSAIRSMAHACAQLVMPVEIAKKRALWALMVLTAGNNVTAKVVNHVML